MKLEKEGGREERQVLGLRDQEREERIEREAERREGRRGRKERATN